MCWLVAQDNEHDAQPVNTIQVAELDGAPNVELPASPTSHHRPNRRSMPDEATDVGVYPNKAKADARIAESDAMAKNLVMLQSMQLQSLAGPSRSFVNQDMDSVESRTIHLLEDVIGGVRQTKHLAGVEERIAHARDLVYRYRTFESNWIIQLQSSMEKLYRKLRPDASDESISALLDRFDVLISVGAINSPGCSFEASRLLGFIQCLSRQERSSSITPLPSPLTVNDENR